MKDVTQKQNRGNYVFSRRFGRYSFQIKVLSFLISDTRAARRIEKSTQDCSAEVERTQQLQETHSISFYKHQQISGKIFLKTKVTKMIFA